MINRENNFVQGHNIESVWRDSIWLCVLNGYDYIVEHGSYVGQIRRQLPFVTLRLTEPWKRPFTPFMPPGYPPPTSEESINNYFAEKIMGTVKSKNHSYTYGMWITKQIDRVIEILKQSNGHSNQACISIGDNSSVYLDDPPCLRAVTFKLVDTKLNMSIVFRSWDLFSALPENIGALQLLKEYVLSELQDHFYVRDGDIIAFSDGLHIYEQYFKLVNELNIDKIDIGENRGAPR